jgi:hypothetical protein
MAAETKQAILACIDEILTTLGQKDYGAFREKVDRGSVMLTNLGRWAGELAALNYDEVAALIDRRSEEEQQHVLRLLIGLKGFLPFIGIAVKEAAKIFPPPEGERSTALKNRESEQKACQLVMYRIESSDSEAEAKRYAASKFKVDERTMHRIWKRRSQLLAAKSFEEFFGQFLKGLSTTTPPIQTTETKVPDEPASDVTPEDVHDE